MSANPAFAPARESASDSSTELERAMREIHAGRQRLAAPDHLSSERRHFSDKLEDAPDAYLVTDSGGCIREANQAARALLGTGAAAPAGHSLVSFVLETERAAFRALLVAVRGDPWARPAEWHGALARSGRKVLFRARAVKSRQRNAQGLCWLLAPL